MRSHKRIAASFLQGRSWQWSRMTHLRMAAIVAQHRLATAADAEGAHE
jgi:hypothetical protein